MTDWVKAMNPTSQATTEAEALAAARASAIAMFIGAIFGAVGVFMMLNGGLAEIEKAMAAASGGDAATAAMSGSMAKVTLYSAIFFTVLQAILGYVQWTKPNKVLPILFIVLVVYGIGSTALSQMMAGQMNLPETSTNSPLFITVGYVVMVVELILHIAGIRGVGRLDEIRTQMAQ
jgi:hypothetical protein